MAGLRWSSLGWRRCCNCHGLHLRHRRLGRHRIGRRRRRLSKLRRRNLVRLWLRRHRCGPHRSLNPRHGRNRRRRDGRHWHPRRRTTGGLRRCGWRRPSSSTLWRSGCAATGKLEHTHVFVLLGRLWGSGRSLRCLGRWRSDRRLLLGLPEEHGKLTRSLALDLRWRRA